MDKWTAACVAQTGLSNEFAVEGTRYFWEASRKEHADGAITGTILRVLGPAPRSDLPAGTESFYAKRVGSFRINPDGTIGRAPAFLQAAAKVAGPRTRPGAVGSGGSRA